MLSTIINHLFPRSFHDWKDNVDKQVNTSKARETYLLREIHYRAVVLNQISPHTTEDWYFKRLNYLQFLFEMIRECDQLALRSDKERLLLEVLAIKQAEKKRRNGQPTTGNRQRATDKQGFDEVNTKETKYHTDKELTDAETAELVRMNLTDFEKARAIKKAMKSFTETDRTRAKVSNALTKAMGAGWSESTIKPYYAAFNAAWEIENPSPITAEW